jgi:hypothetical protein
MSILDFHASLSKENHTELASLSRLSAAQRLREVDPSVEWGPWY